MSAANPESPPAPTPLSPFHSRLLLLARPPKARLALLATAAALTVALPLGQVLRDQQAELERLGARGAALDPLARSVDVQRGLLKHGDVAGLVLRGNAAAEADRRVCQSEVEDRMLALAMSLAAGPWERALREGDVLRDDWHLLAERVSTRRVTALDSDGGHRLLVEQTLAIIDILDAAQLGGLRDQRAAAALSDLYALPRRAARSHGTAPAWSAELARFDTALPAAAHELRAARQRTEQARNTLLAAVAGLAFLTLLLARPLWRLSLTLTSNKHGNEGPPPVEPDKRVLADGLFHRLRSGTALSAERRDDTPLG